MFANSQMGGVDLGMPDVCLTPTPAPVPIPYPAMAAGPTVIPAAAKILFMCTPAHNMASVAPMTNGNNPGINLGVASGTVMGPMRHTSAAFTVLLCGAPATRMSSAAMENSTNDPVGVRIAPSQLKVILLAP